MRVIGTVATLQHMEHPICPIFTFRQLTCIETQSPGKPIFPNFSRINGPVGLILSAWSDEKKVFVTAEIYHMFLSQYLVPVIRIFDPKTHETGFEVISFGVTKTPADSSLQPLQEFDAKNLKKAAK